MPSSRSASELARRLGRDAEAACRHYLPKGRKEGNYWLVGDVLGAPGRSLYVRLKASQRGAGAAGKWTDAATGEHGDLLDLIGLNCGLPALREVLCEARRFLRLPRPPVAAPELLASPRGQSAPLGKVEAARRLFAASGPIAGTLGEAYLRHRALAVPANGEALRFHPRCYYRDVASGRRLEFPALIGAVTDAAGALTGVLRTWLAPDGKGLAPIDTPRRASGRLLGGGVRFGLGAKASSILFAGEGIETMLSLRAAMPGASLIAALSANHLAACSFPKTLRRLYVAVDADLSGRRALARLIDRGREAGIEVVALHPALGDFNDDLRSLGLAALRAGLRGQLIPCDAAELLPAAM